MSRPCTSQSMFLGKNSISAYRPHHLSALNQESSHIHTGVNLEQDLRRDLSPFYFFNSPTFYFLPILPLSFPLLTMVIQQGKGDLSPPAPMLDPPLYQQHSYDQVTFFFISGRRPMPSATRDGRLVALQIF